MLAATLISIAFLPPATVIDRRAVIFGAALAGPLTATHASATAGSLLKAAGVEQVKAKPKELPGDRRVVEDLNLAEEKLAEILAANVAKKEKEYGFKLDAEDVKDVEDILRNKYCG